MKKKTGDLATSGANVLLARRFLLELFQNHRYVTPIHYYGSNSYSFTFWIQAKLILFLIQRFDSCCHFTEQLNFYVFSKCMISNPQCNNLLNKNYLGYLNNSLFLFHNILRIGPMVDLMGSVTTIEHSSTVITHWNWYVT